MFSAVEGFRCQYFRLAIISSLVNENNRALTKQSDCFRRYGQEADMKGAKIALLAMFMLMCGEKTGKTVSSPNEMRMGESRTAQLPPANNGPPVTWFPVKEQYVTREGDPLFVLVTITCDAGSPNEARFELLQPTPGFVSLVPVCSPPGTPFAKTLVVIAPGQGDAGKHEVSLGSTRCGHPEDAVRNPIVRLFVKVKKAR
jgi:hypothetical protein